MLASKRFVVWSAFSLRRSASARVLCVKETVGSHVSPDKQWKTLFANDGSTWILALKVEMHFGVFRTDGIPTLEMLICHWRMFELRILWENLREISGVHGDCASKNDFSSFYSRSS